MTERQITARIKKIKALEARKAELENQITAAKAEITADMMLRDVDSLEAGGFLVRFTKVITNRLDSKALKADLPVLWSSFFVTLVAKKYRLATMLPFVPRMVCDSR